MRKTSDDDTESTKRKDSKKKEDSNNKINNVLKKKAKSGLAKIKNHIQSTVVKGNKFVQFVKKSTKTIPQLLYTKEQSKALLPKLETIIFSDQIKEEYNTCKSRFQQIGHQLTHSLVMFEKSPQYENQHIQAVDMQTQKCYKSIPAFYFKQHINLDELTLHLTLTKDYRLMQQNIYCLMDYLDQVEFNINEQAGAKIKIFMNFIFCMNSIQGLVNINLKNLEKTRKFICILRDIIVSKSIRINQQRQKKEKIQQVLNRLVTLKKLKQIQNKLTTQISLGRMISHDPKSKLGAMLAQYCEIHNVKLQKFCCKSGNNLCKYWDINYFIEKGFQQNFMKMIRSYLFEVINCEREIQNFKKLFIINKKNFMTAPTHPAQGGVLTDLLDESYEVDAYDHVELITKIHIQKQIIAMFEQGMHKYNFSTEQLEVELKEFLSNYIRKFLNQITAINETGNKLSQNNINNLGQCCNTDFLNSEKLKEKLIKLGWMQFNKMIEMISLRFEYLNIRLLSLFQKIFAKTQQLKKQQSERHQIICVYLSSLINMQLSLADESIQKLLKLRVKETQKSIGIFKSKQQIVQEFDIESQNMKKIVKHCKKWLVHIQSAQKTYKLCKVQLSKVFCKSSDKNIPTEYYWSPKMKRLKTILAKNAYELFHKTFICRDLKEKLEEDNWQVIQIKTDIYDDIGYVIGGLGFLQEEERQQRNLLSNSILIERSFTDLSNSIHSNVEQYSSKFKINPSYITLGDVKFKIVSSTEQMIKALRKYLQLFDDTTESDKKTDFQTKLTELLIMYNLLIKDLILKEQALKLGKITTKTITAKQLIIVYIQLQVIQTFFAGTFIQSRVGLTKEECSVIQDKIRGTGTQICKKYQKNIQLCIKESVESLNLKDSNISQTQQFSSIPKYIKSSISLFVSLMLSEREYIKFLDLDNSWITQLVNKLNKLQNSKEIKKKCFTFLENELQQFEKYIPKLILAIRSMIYQKL